MRKPDFWQALLSLDYSHQKSRELLARLGTHCITADDLVHSAALTTSERKKLLSTKPLTPEQLELVKPVSLEDAEFPENLRVASNPPSALMVRGSINADDANAVAIVGTRKPSAYGRAVARQIATELAKGGITIVSGAAYGIDAEAHKGAIQVGGRTIAVLGSGLDRPYPTSHTQLLSQIAENGAVVSQFAIGTKPDYYRFPMRNEVIAGLSKAIVIIEAPDKSGAISTATRANEEGRHVFVTPGQIDNLNYRGSFRLINDGATLLYSPDQVFEALGISRRVGKRETPKVTPQQKRILDSLSTEPELADNLSEKLGEPSGVILAELTMLELEGLVSKASGGYVKL